MIELMLVLIGIFIGAGGMYIVLRNRGAVCELHGVASYVEQQQTEKQTRKERILTMAREKGTVTNDDVEKSLGVSDATATNYLSELEREGKIEQIGERGRFVTYRLKGN